MLCPRTQRHIQPSDPPFVVLVVLANQNALTSAWLIVKAGQVRNAEEPPVQSGDKKDTCSVLEQGSLSNSFSCISTLLFPGGQLLM